MAVSLKITLDTVQFDKKMGRILNIKKMQESFVRRAAKRILQESRDLAPKSPEGINKEPHMVEDSTQSFTRKDGFAAYSVVFVKFDSNYNFDVAAWLHDPEEFSRGGYTPSAGPPRGPKFLVRAFEKVKDELKVKLVADVNTFINTSGAGS